MVAYMWEEGVG